MSSSSAIIRSRTGSAAFSLTWISCSNAPIDLSFQAAVYAERALRFSASATAGLTGSATRPAEPHELFFQLAVLGLLVGVEQRIKLRLGQSVGAHHFAAHLA